MIIIGDVHGCYKTLMKLIKQFPKDEKLCFVGDLIDRGTENKKVLDYVFDNNIDCVLGNHEEMMLEDFSMWIFNGGNSTLSEFKEGEFEKYFNKIKKLPYYLIYPDIIINERKLIVCHAGLCYTDLQQNIETRMITWVREDILDHKEYFQVCGHSPVREPKIFEHYANIDTGAVFNNKKFKNLTALQVPEMKIFQQINIE